MTPSASRPEDPTTRELSDLARRTRAGRTWDPDADSLAPARNAHHSNTPEEMREALEGDHDFLEGDLRLDDAGRAVLAHDADQEGDGLTLEQWLAVGNAGGRGMKVDVKEPEVIPQLLDELERSGIPDGRLMLNVQGDDAGVAREIRDRFPDAWIAITPALAEDDRYDEDSMRSAVEAADAAGGRITFPVRWDRASDEVIEHLRPHGSVSVWTSSGRTPNDAEEEAVRLRERGVDGVIDLGGPSSVAERIAARAEDVWNSGPARGARDLGGDVVDVGRAGVDVAADGVGLIGDGLETLGGWLG